eukprot:3586627-Pyramimonas_sp.AAC.1
MKMKAKVVTYVVNESIECETENSDGTHAVVIKQYSKLRLWIRKRMRSHYNLPDPADDDDEALPVPAAEGADAAGDDDDEYGSDAVAKLRDIVKARPD